MNNFFKGPRNQISTLCICADGFKFSWCFVVEKMEIQVFACSYETMHLLILKILTENLFKMLVAAFRKLHVILLIIPSAFSKAEMRFPILFEVPPEILTRFPVKFPELRSVFRRQART